MNKKSLIVFLGLGTLAFGQVSKTVSYFPLNKVALSESVFSRAMQTDKNYIMSMDADRLLAPYLKEAGLNPKKNKLSQLGKYRIGWSHWRPLYFSFGVDVRFNRRCQSKTAPRLYDR
ncbi:hypothetical protein ACFOEQ_07675 [Chryseobacterium arachidis]|uniref:hypothetical protein n=1 Tax=Chryseobacterium arachidis TaxID=1416778 RepID=UPI00362167D9